MFRKLGFTMIELLIVIAVLGILAVAVLAAINPIEQINRGRDTGSRSDAEQLLGAIDRYYTTKGFYPWQTAATDVANEDLAWTTAGAVADTAATPILMLDKLSTGGTAEIKSSFVERITDATYNSMFVYNQGTQGDSTYVCFLPKSGSFAEEAETRCVDTDGSGLPDDIDGATKALICGDATDKYICLP